MSDLTGVYSNLDEEKVRFLGRLLTTALDCTPQHVERMWADRHLAVVRLCELQKHAAHGRCLTKTSTRESGSDAVFFALFGDELRVFDAPPRVAAPAGGGKLLCVWPAPRADSSVGNCSAASLSFLDMPWNDEFATASEVVAQHLALLLGAPLPTAVKQQVAGASAEFCIRMSELQALATGRFVLSGPPCTLGDAPATRSLDVEEKHVAEWIRKIRELIRQRVEPTTLADDIAVAPADYLAFWVRRHDTLQQALRELAAPHVRATLDRLRAHGSCLAVAMREVAADAERAAAEAEQLARPLAALLPLATQIHCGGVQATFEAMVALLHGVALVWSSCQALTLSRWAALVKSIVLAVGAAALRHVGTVFGQWEPASAISDAHARLSDSLELCASLRTALFSYQSAINAGRGPRKWRVDNHRILASLTAVEERLDQARAVVSAAAHARALETLRFGGVRGDRLEADLHAVTKSFLAALMRHFQPDVCHGDLTPPRVATQLRSAGLRGVGSSDSEQQELQPGGRCASGAAPAASCGQFDAAFAAFRGEETAFNSSCLGILRAAFDDCETLDAVARLMMSLAPLRSAPHIDSLVTQHFATLLQRYDADLGDVNRLLSAAGDAPPLHRFGDELQWLRAISSRITAPMETIKAIDDAALSHPLAHAVSKKRAALSKIVERRRNDVASKWHAIAAHALSEHLDQPLLRNEQLLPTGPPLLVANLHPEVASVLQQHHLMARLGAPLPEAVQQQLSAADDALDTNACLDRAAHLFNSMNAADSGAEAGLARALLERAQQCVKDGLHRVVWTSPGKGALVSRFTDLVRHAHGRLTFIKGNRACITRILAAWRRGVVSVFRFDETIDERRRTLADAFLSRGAAHDLSLVSGSSQSETDQAVRRVLRRWRRRVSYAVNSMNDMSEQHRRIVRLLHATRDALHLPTDSDVWCSYVREVERSIASELRAITQCCMERLVFSLDQVRTSVESPAFGIKPGRVAAGEGMDLGNPMDRAALLLVRLELGSSGPVLVPTIDLEDVTAVQFRVFDWVARILGIAGRLPKLLDHHATFYEDVADDEVLNLLREDSLVLLQLAIDKIQRLRDDYTQYQFLWRDAPHVQIANFMKGVVSAPDGAAAMAAGEHADNSAIHERDSASPLTPDAEQLSKSRSMLLRRHGTTLFRAGDRSMLADVQQQQQEEQQQQQQRKQWRLMNGSWLAADPFASADEETEQYEEAAFLAAEARAGAPEAAFLQRRAELRAKRRAKQARAASRQKPALPEIEEGLARYERLADEIAAMPATVAFGWVSVDCSPMRERLLALARTWRSAFVQHLLDRAARKLEKLEAFMRHTEACQQLGELGDYPQLVTMITLLMEVAARTPKYDAMFDPMREIFALLQRHEVLVPHALLARVEEDAAKWRDTKRQGYQLGESLQPIQQDHLARLRVQEREMHSMIRKFVSNRFPKEAPLSSQGWIVTPRRAYTAIRVLQVELEHLSTRLRRLRVKQELFQAQAASSAELVSARQQLVALKALWDVVAAVTSTIRAWGGLPLARLDNEAAEEQLKRMHAMLKTFDRQARAWPLFREIEDLVREFLATLPIAQSLRSPAMCERHWNELQELIGATRRVAGDISLDELVSLRLHEHAEAVFAVVERAQREAQVAAQLVKLREAWRERRLSFVLQEGLGGSPVHVAILPPELSVVIEEQQTMLHQLSVQRHTAEFSTALENYRRALATVECSMSMLADAQQQWARIRTIFTESDDARAQLPGCTERFDALDARLRAVLAEIHAYPGDLMQLCEQRAFDGMLQPVLDDLEVCERGLGEFLMAKRALFPRLFFVSTVDLLDLLSAPTSAPAPTVNKHVAKLFPGVLKLVATKDDRAATTLTTTTAPAWRRARVDVTHCIGAGEGGEQLTLHRAIGCEGRVERWLRELLAEVQRTMASQVACAITSALEVPRAPWLEETTGQVALLVGRVLWAAEVVGAFQAREEGNESAMRDLHARLEKGVVALVREVQRPQALLSRTKLMNMITYEVHGRDVVAQLMSVGAEGEHAFEWQRQLRVRYNEREKKVYLELCDVTLEWAREYLGNTPRLVIVPLTSRIYITLVQALSLKLGGAPVGPAGTGKTETTKDLAAHVGKPVFVFNCSAQMSSTSLGMTFRGIAASGAWACFDEFNRIAVGVLSVLSTQYKAVLDALRENRSTFMLEGVSTALDPTCGVFVTMNPGYAGRTELPESLKALFRPVTVATPDTVLICENLLMAEGIMRARDLARKIVTLFQRSADLLTPRTHYDWGLRALKTVLATVGRLRRLAPDTPDENLVLQALRSSMQPRIMNSDTDTFRSLVHDLFRDVPTPRIATSALDDAAKGACGALKLVSEEALLVRVQELMELTDARHCVLILGAPGAGKTSTWRVLVHALRSMGRQIAVKDLNPKVVPASELFGAVSPTTKEWRDGLLTCLIRDLAFGCEGAVHRWLLLDGDLDTDWIESLNSVMDDNKVLTLANSERIALRPDMRLIFEVCSVAHATPATISRAAVLHISESDIGWMPVAQAHLEGTTFQATLMPLLDKYVPTVLTHMLRDALPKVPVNAVACVATLTRLCAHFLSSSATDKEVESVFMVCCVWAFAGTLVSSSRDDNEARFDKFWRREFRVIKFPPPEQGTVFDFFFSCQSHRWERWGDRTTAVSPRAASFVPIAARTSRGRAVAALAGVFLAAHQPVMLVGDSGSGKSAVMARCLQALQQDGQQTASFTIHFSYATSATGLQEVVEQQLERRAGNVLGPHGGGRLVLCLEDLNVVRADNFGTQSTAMLLKQLLDHQHWYSAPKWGLHEIRDVTLAAVQDADAVGGRALNASLQRHFAAFALGRVSQREGPELLMELLEPHVPLRESVAQTLVEIHHTAEQHFPRSPANPHYGFSLRHLLRVFENINRLSDADAKIPRRVIDLLEHEVHRVYGDPLSTRREAQLLARNVRRLIATRFPDVEPPAADYQRVETFYSSHLRAMGEHGSDVYELLAGPEAARAAFDAALQELGALGTPMNLALFDEACLHVCRFLRLLDPSRGGHMLCVGVGGTGRASLARLAAHIAGMRFSSLRPPSGRLDLEVARDVVRRAVGWAGVKREGVVLFASESDMESSGPAREAIAALLNDVVLSGDSPGLIQADERERIARHVGPVARRAGYGDAPADVWKFYVDAVQRHLRVIVTATPGKQLRVLRLRFPGLVNTSNVCWFHPWPTEALSHVAASVLARQPLSPREPSPLEVDAAQLTVAVEHLTFAHTSACGVAAAASGARRAMAAQFTPKSFVVAVETFRETHVERTTTLRRQQARYREGLELLAAAAQNCEEMQAVIERQQARAMEQKLATEALLSRLYEERSQMGVQTAKAEDEEAAAAMIQAELQTQNTDCDRELCAAEPVLAKAARALERLNKSNLTELKTFKQPPQEVQNVGACVIILMSPPGTVLKNRSWAAAQRLMQRVDVFLAALRDFNKEGISDAALLALKPYLAHPSFNGDAITVKSFAAAELCEWVRNVVEYNRIYRIVKPKRDHAQTTKERLEDANARVTQSRRNLQQLKEKLQRLHAEFDAAEAERHDMIHCVERSQLQLRLSARLVAALGNERVRWRAELSRLEEASKSVLGDALLAASFVAYAGAFHVADRAALVGQMWLPRLADVGIPVSASDPLELLATAADRAAWENEGLPSDAVSGESAAVVLRTRCVPLLLDPQMQGVEWCRRHFAERNRAVVLERGDGEGLCDAVKLAVSRGDALFVDVGDGTAIDPVLLPALRRGARRGGSGGDAHIVAADSLVLDGDSFEVHTNFTLILFSRLASPHLPQEIASTACVVNFTVTPRGLEAQLLSHVAQHVRAETAAAIQQATREVNVNRVQLHDLEDQLMRRLSGSGSTLLHEEAVSSTEALKATAARVAANAESALRSRRELEGTMEAFRPVAARGSVFFFSINELHRLDPVYQYSMVWFTREFSAALRACLDSRVPAPPQCAPADRASVSPEGRAFREMLDAGVTLLTRSLFTALRRGMFERDQPTAALLLAINVLEQQGNAPPSQLRYVLCGDVDVRASPRMLAAGMATPAWMPADVFRAAVQLSEGVEGFASLSAEIEGGGKRWRDWFASDAPERERLPGELRDAGLLAPLALMRALRPDRFPAAAAQLVAAVLGPGLLESDFHSLDEIVSGADAESPVLYLLFAGADPAKEMDALSRHQQHFVAADGGAPGAVRLTSVALGEGQEATAAAALDVAMRRGEWVLLQNVHLMCAWAAWLERLLDTRGPHAHRAFRLFITAESVRGDPARELPVPLLQRCIKLVREPPVALPSSMARALAAFPTDFVDRSSKPGEFKLLLYALCLFHCALVGRHRYGAAGWSRNYDFGTADLTISAGVLLQQMERHQHYVPLEELRFMIGDITYGGHITDAWDRRTCAALLQCYFSEEVLAGATGAYVRGIPVPAPDGAGGAMHALCAAAEALPPDSPIACGLHANAATRHAVSQCATMCAALSRLKVSAPARAGGGGASLSSGDGDRGAASSHEPAAAGAAAADDDCGRVHDIAEEVLARLVDIDASGAALCVDRAAAPKATPAAPFTAALHGEFARLQHVVATVRRSLTDIARVLRGAASGGPATDALLEELPMHRVPELWQAAAGWPTTRPLRAFVDDLVERAAQLDAWASAAPDALGGPLPKSVWVGGLFNPTAFLTALLQTAARKSGIALEQLALASEVLRKHDSSEIGSAPRDGAHIHGLLLDGARWDIQAGALTEPMPRELFGPLPPVLLRAVAAAELHGSPATEPRENPGLFTCPVFRSASRGASFVFALQLRTTSPPSKWAVRGAAAVISIE